MWEFLGFFFSYDDMICGALIVARARAGCCDAAAWGAPRSAGLSAAVSLLLSRLSLPRYPKAMKPPIKPPPSEMPARAPSESAVAPERAVASERASERRWVGFNPWVGSPPPPPQLAPTELDHELVRRQQARYRYHLRHLKAEGEFGEGGELEPLCGGWREDVLTLLLDRQARDGRRRTPLQLGW